MAAMTIKRRKQGPADHPSDRWLWPIVVLLVIGGWGQVLWIWNNIHPKGLAPLWLLLWVGIGVSSVAVPIHWLGRRWRPIAWGAIAAWFAVPSINGLASDFGQAVQAGHEWLYNISPLLLLLLLGVGLSGMMTTMSGFPGSRWPGPASNVRALRQGFWAGLFSMICGWLLINRAFSLIPVVLLASALVLIESFLVTRESPRERKR